VVGSPRSRIFPAPTNEIRVTGPRRAFRTPPGERRRIDADCSVFRGVQGGAFQADSTRMLWFFERDGRYLRLESRTELEGEGFEILVTEADGSTKLERFDTEHEVIARHGELEHGLQASGWHGPVTWRI
jgi:hypothetical protein